MFRQPNTWRHGAILPPPKVMCLMLNGCLAGLRYSVPKT
ncbi:hypothetical protein LSAT2_018814, partial [Lamellibrachia satsuma]